MLASLLALCLLQTTCGKCGHTYEKSHPLTDQQLTRALRVAADRNKQTLSRSALHASKRIAWRESSNRPYAKNPKSSAYGLYQFLNATWKDYGVQKTGCPACQSRAFLIYVKDRYGTPERALAFHRKHGRY
jgi:hypothetical protein